MLWRSQGTLPGRLEPKSESMHSTTVQSPHTAHSPLRRQQEGKRRLVCRGKKKKPFVSFTTIDRASVKCVHTTRKIVVVPCYAWDTFMSTPGGKKLTKKNKKDATCFVMVISLSENK